MKKIEFKIGVGVLVLGCIGFGFANASATKKNIESEAQMIPIDSNFWGLSFTETNPVRKQKDLSFYVGGKYSKTVSQEKLKNATNLADIIPNYPSLWIDRYEQVILSIVNGQLSKSIASKGPELLPEQKALIQGLDINSEVQIELKYGALNTVTERIESHEMKVQFMVVPDRVAEFKGGYDAMISYFKDNTGCGFTWADKMSAEIHFMINAKGETENVELVYEDGSTELGERFVKVIEQMPIWKAAVNVKGEYVMQEFVFVVGNESC